MAKKQMTLGLINMFISEVDNLFAPLMKEVTSRESILKIQADIEARRELGIYELTMRKAQLELELAEITRKIKVYTERDYTKRPPTSVYEHKVEEILDRLRAGNPTLREIEKEKQQVIRNVRIAALGDDMRDILMNTLPKVIEGLTQKVAALPPVQSVRELPEIE
jgi:hypothetical protein